MVALIRKGDDARQRANGTETAGCICGPILQRLLQYPEVRRDCVGAFGECSPDLHSLLSDTVCLLRR